MEEKKEKILQIVLGTITFVISIIINNYFKFDIVYQFLIYLVPYIIVSYDSFKEGIEGIKEGEIFNENILMIVASVGAMVIGFFNPEDPEFNEAIFVMLFFNIGELFEIIAEGKSEKSIESLMDIRPDYANLVSDHDIKKVDPNEVKKGDIIVIKPGEKVPLDGIVIEGTSSMDTAVITGESVPRVVNISDEIYSGFINKTGVLKVKVSEEFKDSTASKIIDLVKNATSKKSNSEKFISKFSKYYTPIVLILAVLIAIIPSIVTKDYLLWILRALTFLIVSCPCALVISVPLAYFGGIGGASKKGILFKGSNYLESLEKMDTIVFDKTGTLTKGVFEVTTIHPKEMSKEELLHIVFHVEEYSTHPIALSLIKSYKDLDKYDKKDECKITNIKEIAGNGVSANVNGKDIYVGNLTLMEKINIKIPKCDHLGTIIHVATDDTYLGHIVISDIIKNDAKEAINYFDKNNINVVMLTGDNENTASKIADELKIKNYYSELLPKDKVEKLENLLDKKRKIAFVGDGINDAPVLARADIGISMGKFGSDAAIEASDIVIMNDKLASIKDAIKISKKTNIIAKENIIFSIFIKVLVLVLSSFGIASMWMAVFADVGVTIIAILNSIRTLKNK